MASLCVRTFELLPRLICYDIVESDLLVDLLAGLSEGVAIKNGLALQVIQSSIAFLEDVETKQTSRYHLSISKQAWLLFSFGVVFLLYQTKCIACIVIGLFDFEAGKSHSNLLIRIALGELENVLREVQVFWPKDLLLKICAKFLRLSQTILILQLQ